MNLSLFYLKNKVFKENAILTGGTFFCLIVLLSINQLKLGFLTLLVPVLFLLLTKKNGWVFVTISTFFFQMKWIELSESIRVFAIDFVFVIFLAYYLIKKFRNTENACDIGEGISLHEILYPLILFQFFAILSTFMNLYRFNESMTLISIWYNLKCFQLLFAVIIITSLNLRTSTIEKIYDYIIIMALFQFPISIIKIMNGNDITGSFTEHHSYVGTILILPFLLTIYKIWKFNKEKEFKFVLGYLSAATIILYLIYGSASRSALFGLGVSFCIFMIMNMLSKKLIVTLSTLAIALIILVISVKFTPLGAIIDKSINSTDSASSVDLSSLSRLLIWKYTWINFLKFPVITKLFGIGIGSFGFLQQHFVIWNGNQTFTGAHLNVLHVLVETGIVGLISFMSIFISILIVFCKYKKYPIALVGFYSTIAMLFSGVSQETFWFQPVFGSLWLFYIVLLCLILLQLKLLNQESKLSRNF